MEKYSYRRALRWLWLSLISEPGSASADLITEYFHGDINAIYEADPEEYRMIEGLRKPIIDRMCDKSLSYAEEIADYCAGRNIGTVFPDMEAYPRRLAGVQRHPLVLFVRGTLPKIDENVCIAVVGTRNQTEYGASVAYSISYDMARAGAIIVSGLARGVDGMAHRAAIDAGGKTVAVLGSGVDRPYPYEHAELLEEITAHGAVISEYVPTDGPASYRFPARNRIVSALSLGTLVIEAPKRSGALITARDAIKQGRDIFAVPGKLGEGNSEGTNELIKSGASIATCAADVLSRYIPLYPGRLDTSFLSAPAPVLRRPAGKTRPSALTEPLDPVKEEEPDFSESTPADVSGAKEPRKPQNPRKKPASTKPASMKPASNKPAPSALLSEEAEPEQKPAPSPASAGLTLNETEEAILSLVPIDGSISADELIRLSGKPLSEVFTTLTVLEIRGILRALPGGQFTRS